MRILLSLCLIALSQWMSAGLLYDILDGKYAAKSHSPVVSMQDGENYTQLIGDSAIVKFSYKTGLAVDTLFRIGFLKNKPFKSIQGYQIDPTERRLLVFHRKSKRYRRSFTAAYYVYDIKRKEINALSSFVPQENALFSPDGRYIAFAHKNNLHLYKTDFKSEIQITKDGEKDKIINGIADWVYEEEFENTRYFEWSPDSKLLAFVKFDESGINKFSYEWFRSPEEENWQYPENKSFKYPKAGTSNSTVRVCVYDDFNKTTHNIKLPEMNGGFYVPRIKWTNSADKLAVFQLNRVQNQLDMYLADPRSTSSQMIWRQTEKAYVDYSRIDDITFSADNKSFLAVSEQDGYAHIYKYGMNGNKIKQLTRGNWEVTDFYGMDEKTGSIYFQADDQNPMQRDLYAINSKGIKTRLSAGNGTSIAHFSIGLKYYIEENSSVIQPTQISVKNQYGKLIRIIENNSKVKNAVNEIAVPAKEFFSFKNPEGIQLNGWMVKPLKMESGKKYPVLLVQYSGPGSQQVLDKWSIGWEYYLAGQGVIVACVDGRGTGGRGTAFRNCTYMQMGDLESKDQISAAKYIGTLPFADSQRIGIWGWSYGGSTTLWSMSTGDNVFKAGIAIAPVTDWRLYNSAYTERYMRTPQENDKGYESTSLLHKADKLEGRLLIVHGVADDNVHYMNTMLYVEKLIAANKQFEMQIYPNKEHSLLGVQTRHHLYDRLWDFITKNLL